jgi:HAD superfamily hydrolase (TIGR01549 family)
MGAPAAVLFDWDGTLLDSAEASYRCYVRLFDSYGIGFDRDLFGRTYSPNWHRTYEAVGLAPDRWPEADQRWLEHYCAEESRLVPGAREALRRLEEAGVPQGLVTSGDRTRVSRELSALGVERYFGAVVCGGDTRNRKPHPEALLLALGRMGVRPGEAAYVGDSPEDVEMARAAGVRAVGVPGGFPNREALAASRPDVMAPDVLGAVNALVDGPAPGREGRGSR